MSFLRTFINFNNRLSAAFDRLLPSHYSIDGNQDFLKNLVPPYLKPGLRIADVGGGSVPLSAPRRNIPLGFTSAASI